MYTLPRFKLFNRAALVGLLLFGAFPLVGAAQSAPDINSPENVSATVGSAFTYEITTIDDNATFFSNTGLPSGLSRTGAIISGFPETAGNFQFSVGAGNGAGSDSQLVTLVVEAADPVITSVDTVQGRSGVPFSFTITATNAADSFTATGLPDGLVIDGNSRTISGIPTVDGNFDVLLTASNGSGQGTQTLRINLLPDIPGAGAPTVEIVSPATGRVFEGNTESIVVTAEITPTADGVIDTVFAKWVNPPAGSGISEVILTELESVGFNPGSGKFTYTGTIPLGFNPNDRELGGGDIDLEVVAFQTNATSAADVGSDKVNFQIKPILEILFPTTGSVVGGIVPGDLFAAARLSTNNFDNISALVTGPGIVDVVSDSDNSDNENGVFNFFSDTSIALEGTYSLRVTAADVDGNTTIRELEFTVSDTLAEPVAVVLSPAPGFSNEIFSPALFTWAQDGAPEPVIIDGVQVATRIDYNIFQVSEGRGYHPRNATGQNLPYTFQAEDGNGGQALISNQTLVNGRLTEMANAVTIRFPGESNGFGPRGSGLVDDRGDPGAPSRIDIVGELTPANAPLDFFRIFVNGEDVTPGNGNLNAADGVLDVPLVSYPSVGNLPPGDYVVVVEVTDTDGEVGISNPLSFRILPFEPLNIEVSRVGLGDVDQGEEVTFIVDVAPFDIIESVEFFDSASDESLGEAASVMINEEDKFRFVRSFDTRGEFSLFAVATASNGQTVRSSPQTVNVLPVNDLDVFITTPSSDVEIFRGESLILEAQANATPGIESLTWIENNVAQEPVLTERPFRFTRTFNTVGTFRFRVDAVDNFGNRRSSENEILVTVREPEISVDITLPREDQSISAGTSVDFEARATSELNVANVTWSIDGVEFESVGSAPFAVSIPFVSPGTFTVTAEVTDVQGFSASSAGIAVTVAEPNPLLNNSDFIRDTFNRIAGRLPSQSESDDALAQLDSTIESRARYIANLLDTDIQESSTFVQQIFRTMTGEWPNAAQIDDTTESLRESVSSGNSETGSIDAGGTQSFTFNYTAGSSVSVTVTPNANETGIALTDATLTIVGPNGSTIGFSDDSFVNGNFSLNPRIDFIAPESGSYNAIVGGFGLFNLGGFTITSSSTGSGEGSDALSAQAAVQFLIPEYEERFGTFLVSGDVNSPQAVSFIEQIFNNKHGTDTTAQSLTRLANSLRGGNVEFAGFTIPGYGGNVASFVGNFAIDNDPSGLIGVSGFPLTRVHLYSRPNNSLQLSDIALLISTLQGLNPTDARVNELANQGIVSAIETILRSDEYINQLISSNATDAEREAIINQYLGGAQPPSVLPAALAGSDPLGSDWYRSDWFGSFAFDSGATEPWVFSSDFGWVYVSPSGTPDGVWLFSNNLGTWMWGGSTLNGFFYNEDASQWMWVSSNNNGYGAWLYMT
ncbi:MAG: hypothetical protein GVY36_08225, partial [Verrucomicrobia bacterium]|nr:hypothetical protein [Verrucomicrobiota bacterium]